jgi:hypothetical protein
MRALNAIVRCTEATHLADQNGLHLVKGRTLGIHTLRFEIHLNLPKKV